MNKRAFRNKDRDILRIGGVKLLRGERKLIYLDSASLYDYTQLKIPVEVIRGKNPGPILFISAAVHGDEINGIEIIRRLARRKILSQLHGTLILIPVVNIFGFNNKSRYLPDRKDLNRSFPGSPNGSLASRLANVFMKEIVSKCTHGIDLHTGALHRTNLPQIRASLDDAETKNLAKAFGAPVVVNSKLRDGSLREAARKRKVSMLLFEGGQALRFEESVIKLGIKGCISIMKHIGMVSSSRNIDLSDTSNQAFIAKSSYWIRAPRSGAFSTHIKIGDPVEEGDLIATISDLFGREKERVVAEVKGILIGANLLPLINQGDAMFHIATFSNTKVVKTAVEDLFL